MSLLTSKQTADRIKRKLLETPDAGRRRNSRGSLDEHATWIKITNVTGTTIEGVTTVRMGNGTWQEFATCKVVAANGGTPAIGLRYRGYQTGGDTTANQPQYVIDVPAGTLSHQKLGTIPPRPGNMPSELSANLGGLLMVPPRMVYFGIAWVTFKLDSVSIWGNYRAIGEWQGGVSPTPLAPGIVGSFEMAGAVTTNQTTVPFTFNAWNASGAAAQVQFGIREGGAGFLFATNQVLVVYQSTPA